MPWNMNDYPASMKNLDPLIQKKAIDIGNALLHDGYPDERAIPIAISQAEKWFNDAAAKEKKDFQKATAPQKDDPHTRNNNAEKLLTAIVKVQYKAPNWQVISEGASQASNLCTTKEEAVARAKEIAKNKAVSLKIYKQDGQLQETYDYSKT
ncbi:DUF2188 domain-containing protein [Enterococcus pingfangensis]|uniref:DUF2188 domain-containing protein n=1 Tax=Enterococcus pingfangensis TaxID=2559924 RepID=UPI0010F4D03C|nr:DUF2188 domain-containing protein [Enterococcus pingfangensis]